MLKSQSKNWLLICFCFGLYLAPATGQDRITSKLSPTLLLGYQIGGIGENRNFVFKNGPDVLLSLSYNFNKRLSAGLGTGCKFLEKDRFIPFYAEVMGAFQESLNSPYLKLRAGAALAQNNEFELFELYDFDGGLYISAGWGYNFSIFEKLILQIEIDLEFQQASLEFQSFSGATYEEDFQYYHLSFKTGIRF